MRQLLVLGFLLFVAAGVWGLFSIQEWFRAREWRKRRAAPLTMPEALPQEPVALFTLKQAQRMLARHPADAEALAFLDTHAMPTLRRALEGPAGHPGASPFVLSFEVPEADSPQAYALSVWREAFEALGCRLELELAESGEAWRTVTLTMHEARKLVVAARP